MDELPLATGSAPKSSQPPLPDSNVSRAARQGSVHRVVIFRLEGQRYALHLPTVERVVHMVAVSPLPQAPAIVLGVVNFHGQIIPVLDIQRRLGFASRSHGLGSTLLIARTTRRTLALPVDEALGVQEIATDSVKSPATVFPGVGLLAGIAALSDGVLFIHDPDAFLTPDEEQRLTEALEGSVI